MENMAENLTECHLSAMSQQTITATKQVLYMPLYMHGTWLDLYLNPVISQKWTLDS